MAAGLMAAGLSAAGSVGAAAAKSPPGMHKMNDRSATNVQPIGVNLGEVLQPFNQGPPSNGGIPMADPNRFAQQQGKPAFTKTGAIPVAEDPAKKKQKINFALIGGVALGAILLMRLL